MENIPDNIPLYETDMFKNMISGLLGRAPAGLNASFRTSQIYFGINSINQMGELIRTRISNREERRALIITDDFTKKYANLVLEPLKAINAESIV